MSEMNLKAASHQWATRPADERFWTLKDMYMEAYAQASESLDTTVQIKDADIGISDAGDVQLRTPDNGILDLTHWAFSQLALNIGAPANWCRNQLDNPGIVHDVLEASLQKTVRNNKASFQVYHNTATKEALSITTSKYGRAPNHKIIHKLMNLQGNWRTAPGMALDPTSPTARPATKEECAMSTRVKEGDLIDKAGLYLSPEDMFIFLVNPDCRINDGSDNGLTRGFFATNSEVGKKKFKLVSYWFREVCGNNIVWGAQNIEVFSRKHIGENTMEDILNGIDDALAKYANASGAPDEALVKSAQKEIWSTKDDVITALVGMNWTGFGKRKIEDAYQIAEKYVAIDGSPRSPYGISMATSRLSQSTSYADQRTNLDFAAGHILKKFVTL